MSDKNIVETKLLETEEFLYMRNLPTIVTLTWFKGDYSKAEHFLKPRLQKILDANPWLGGEVKRSKPWWRGGDVCLVYQQKDHDLDASDFFTVLDDPSTQAIPPIRRTTPLDQLGGRWYPYRLKAVGICRHAQPGTGWPLPGSWVLHSQSQVMLGVLLLP